MKDLFKMKGSIHLKIFDKEGNLKETIDQDNLIVNLGRQMAVKMLGDGSDGHITHISFGTSDTAAELTDTVITGEYAKVIDGFSFSGTSVIFDFTLGLGECNGMEIREFGLKNVDGDLFSRTTRNVIEKTPDMQITGSWTITA